MATTLIGGSTTTGNITAGQMVIDMADKIYLLEPNAAPLYVLVSKLNKRVAINPTFNWLEDLLNPTWATIGNSAISAVTATTVILTANVGENLYFMLNDLVKFPRTGEVALVDVDPTTLAANQLSLVRGWGTSLAAALVCGDPYFKIGTAFAEGSLNTALSTKSTITTQRTNYCQIFRKSVEISRTLANTELYGGADRPYQRKKKGIELMKEMERTFYFGEPRLDVTTAAMPRRGTGGINSYITTNVTDAGGALTESEFEAFLRTVFRYGSNTRYLFCAPLIVSVVSLWAQGKLQMFPKDKTYGIAITQYLSPHGTVNLVKDVILENLGVVSNVSYYGGYSFAVELDDVIYRYLQNRDIQMETDIQHPGDDEYKDQYICEVGMEFHNEQKHGRIFDVTG
jgi:hypothetical protein